MSLIAVVDDLAREHIEALIAQTTTMDGPLARLEHYLRGIWLLQFDEPAVSDVLTRHVPESTHLTELTCANLNEANNITLLYQYNGGYFSLPGDSGAPVFSSIGSQVSLFGVHWGSGGWFSSISSVSIELGGPDTCAPFAAC